MDPCVDDGILERHHGVGSYTLKHQETSRNIRSRIFGNARDLKQRECSLYAE